MADKTANPTVNILGTHVARISVPELLDRVRGWTAEASPRTILYANAHCLNIAWRDRIYRQALNQADVVCADGIGVVWAGRLLSGAVLHKASGTEWLAPFCQFAVREELRIFILAGRPGAAARAQAALRTRWPGLQVAGTADGFFQGKTEEETLAYINETRPDLVFVGLGTPKQELWLARRRSEIKAPVCWAVGSLFDLVAGLEPWPPEWMQAMALQWLWRLIVDPRGKWRRYVPGNILFVSRVLRQRLNGRLEGAFPPLEPLPGQQDPPDL